MENTNTPVPLTKKLYDELYSDYSDKIDTLIDSIKDERLKSLFSQIRSLETEHLCNSCFDEMVGDTFEDEEE